MPIYEYECRSCGNQFELLVLTGTVPACPECKGRELERLLSGFAVSSSGTRKTNLDKARRSRATSSNLKDERIAEAEHEREHLIADHGYDPAKMKPVRKK